MKINLNFLIVLTLIVILAGASSSTVSAQTEIPILNEPDLPSAEYGIQYSQQLTASGGTGSYTFSLLSGPLPIGFDLSEDGQLTGKGLIYYGSIPGTYPITIQVQDGSGGIGSRSYNFLLEKGIPTLTPFASGNGLPNVPIYWNKPFTLWAEVWLGNSYVQGTANFYVDGNPVPQCQAVALDGHLAVCRNVTMNLSLGEHTFNIAYSPTGYEGYYYPTNVSGNLTVESAFYNVLGFVYKDNDQDGVFDSGIEPRLYEGWTINLDQDCDGEVDVTAISNGNGLYQFSNLPSGHCYRITEVVKPGWKQTNQLEDFWLSNHINFGLDIGNYRPIISLNQDELPSGNVGLEYNYVLTANGGTQPYTFTIYGGKLPDGLTLNPNGTISGTPTSAGSFQIVVQANDANQLDGYKSYIIYIKMDGLFIFTSSSNPSAPGEQVTFTLSATGDVVDPYYGTLPPVGYVSFYADESETPIAGCSNLVLNYDDLIGVGNFPVTCGTDALSQGAHKITAIYTDYFGNYNHSTLSLFQIVTTAELSIVPNTDLPSAKYGKLYSQQLLASGGTEPYTFSLLSGSLPIGFNMSENGLITGNGLINNGSIPGTYPLTILVQDEFGGFGSRSYNFILDKGTPTLTPYASGGGIPDLPIYWNKPFTLWAEVWINNSYVQGTANFYIDGNPVPDCQAIVLESHLAVCKDIKMTLALGEHSFTIEYWPTDYEDYFNQVNVSGKFTVESGFYNIMGFLFSDNNKDGEFDYDNEVRMGDEWTINLDQDCDKVVDRIVTTNANGFYQFENLPGGHCYRITEVVKPGWQQTTQLADFWLSNMIDFGLDIGNYRPTITLIQDVLPSGNLGLEYNHVFTANGGTEPYTFTISDGTLPDGLTLDLNGTLSGTPTVTGSYEIAVQAIDSNQIVGYKYYTLFIRMDGVFTFTSSSNSSAPGDLVIFTVSATGDADDPYYGPIPPVGYVTFYADDTPIGGCSDLILNLDDVGDIGNFPVTCETSALSQGAHQITAIYTDLSGNYNQPTLTLTLDVLVDTFRLWFPIIRNGNP